MKAIKIALAGATVVLVAVMLPLTPDPVYAADVGHIANLVPAESAELETGAGETFVGTFEPLVRSNDTERIEALLPAESYVEVGIGAGEGAWVLMEPLERGHDTGKIEALLPAE
jgi:hypothetical protein